jgi:hypothetical protein
MEVGQAATLSLTLAGEGNLQGVRDPQLPPLDKVRVFPPQQESYDEVRGKVVRGRRTWKWVLVPSEAGTWSLPPIRMAYFDPQLERYETAATEPLTLLATPAATAAAAPAAANRSSAEAADAALRDAASGSARWGHWLPWALSAVFAVFAVVALLLWRRQAASTHLAAAALAAAVATNEERAAGVTPALPVPLPPLAPPAPGGAWHDGNGSAGSAGNAPAAGTKLAPTSARELLGALEQAAAESRPRAFAAAVEDVVREWLDRRWNLPPATPTNRWAEALTTRGAVAHGELLRLLGEELRYLRFAPELGTHEAVRQTALATAKQLIQS